MAGREHRGPADEGEGGARAMGGGGGEARGGGEEGEEGEVVAVRELQEQRENLQQLHLQVSITFHMHDMYIYQCLGPFQGMVHQ